MKKNKIIQFSLVAAGIILFFHTYYSSNKEDIADIDKEVSKKIFKKNKIVTPKYFLYDFNSSTNLSQKLKKNKINFPVV